MESKLSGFSSGFFTLWIRPLYFNFLSKIPSHHPAQIDAVQEEVPRCQKDGLRGDQRGERAGSRQWFDSAGEAEHFLRGGGRPGRGGGQGHRGGERHRPNDLCHDAGRTAAASRKWWVEHGRDPWVALTVCRLRMIWPLEINCIWVFYDVFRFQKRIQGIN